MRLSLLWRVRLLFCLLLLVAMYPKQILLRGAPARLKLRVSVEIEQLGQCTKVVPQV